MEKMTDNALKSIVLKTPLGFDYFDYDEIIMLEAEGNCSMVLSLERDTPTKILHNLSFIEKNYCNEKLIRCHKSFIINLMHIERLGIKPRRVHMKKNLIVPLSERCFKRIRQMSEMNTHKIWTIWDF